MAKFERKKIYRDVADSFINKLKLGELHVQKNEICEFLSQFMDLLKNHIEEEVKDDDSLFTEEIVEQFGLYIIISSITSNLISCTILEKALEEDYTSIEELKHRLTVYFRFDDEERYNGRAYLTQGDGTTSQDENCKTCDDSTASLSSSDFEDFEIYCQIISNCILMIARHIYKSNQDLKKLKSLRNSCKNVLLNFKNSNDTPDEWKDLIEEDIQLSDKVINMMIDIEIFKIEKSTSILSKNNSQIEAISTSDFEENELKSKVRVCLKKNLHKYITQ